MLVQVLTLHRDQQIGLFLQLSPANEQAFWDSPVTHRRILSMDSWGVATGLIVNAALGKFIYQDSHRLSTTSYGAISPFLVVLLQLTQACWLWLPWASKPAYLRFRLRFTLLQRCQRLLQNVITFYVVPLHQVIPLLVLGGSREDKSEVQRFLALFMLYPMTSFLNAINHGLPFTLQSLFVLAKAALDLVAVLPAFVAVAKSAQVEGLARTACSHIELWFAPIARLASLSPDSSMCAAHATEFVFSFTAVLIGVVLPLHLSFWYELSCKAEFLESQLVPGGGLKLLPAVRPGVVLIYVVASLTMAWALCSIWSLRQVGLLLDPLGQ